LGRSSRFLVLPLACHEVQRMRQGDLLRGLAALDLDLRTHPMGAWIA